MHYATHFTPLGVTNGVAKCADIIYKTIYYHGHLLLIIRQSDSALGIEDTYATLIIHEYGEICSKTPVYKTNSL